VKGFEQRRNRLVGSEIRQTLDRPIADVFVRVANRGEQNLRRAFRLDASIAKEVNVPQRIRARTLFAAARRGFETIDG
jgi:hypothetical protein